MQEGQRVTAKLRVAGKTQVGSDQTQVSFQPDYQNNRNQEWAAATPSLSLTQVMLTEIADMFEQGEAIDMILMRNPDQDQNANPSASDQAEVDVPEQSDTAEQA